MIGCFTAICVEFWSYTARCIVIGALLVPLLRRFFVVVFNMMRLQASVWKVDRSSSRKLTRESPVHPWDQRWILLHISQIPRSLGKFILVIICREGRDKLYFSFTYIYIYIYILEENREAKNEWKRRMPCKRCQSSPTWTDEWLINCSQPQEEQPSSIHQDGHWPTNHTAGWAEDPPPVIPILSCFSALIKDN